MKRQFHLYRTNALIDFSTNGVCWSHHGDVLDHLQSVFSLIVKIAGFRKSLVIARSKRDLFVSSFDPHEKTNLNFD